MKQKHLWLKRMLWGGVCAVAAALLLTLLLNFAVNSITLGGSPDYSDIQLATGRSVWYFGSYPLAVAVELLSVFVLGAAIGAATLPFAGEGKKLTLLSLAHFIVTGVLAQVVGWSYQWLGMGRADGPRMVLIIYAVTYALIWGGRWILWYAELRKLRRALGLGSHKEEDHEKTGPSV